MLVPDMTLETAVAVAMGDYANTAYTWATSWGGMII